MTMNRAFSFFGRQLGSALIGLYLGAAGAAGLLGVSERRFRDLRGNPEFPAGHLLGGSTLRWRVADLFGWADRPQRSRFSRAGGCRPGLGRPKATPQQE